MIDWKKPYDQVYGVPGVGYVQDGVSYQPDGTPVETVQVNMKNDDGTDQIIDVAKPLAKDLHVEPAKSSAKTAEDNQKEIEKAFPTKIPDFIRNGPIQLKYPSQMSAIECREELDEKGVEYGEDTLRRDLRELVKKNR